MKDKFNEKETTGKERKLKNPYPEYPALGEGGAGHVFISYIIVYYSLN